MHKANIDSFSSSQLFCSSVSFLLFFLCEFPRVFSSVHLIVVSTCILNAYLKNAVSKRFLGPLCELKISGLNQIQSV